MQLLNSSELLEVAGGLVFTCEEALIYNVTSFFHYEDVTKACTKDQFTAYALGTVDIMYNTPNFWDLSTDETDRLEVDMIKSLRL